MIQYLIPGQVGTPKSVAFLVPEREMKLDELKKNYFAPLELQGVNIDEIVVFNLKHGPKGKVTASEAREHLDALYPILKSMDIEIVAVSDGTYFKALTKVKKVAPNLGYTCSSADWPDMSIFYVPGYRQMYFNPDVGNRISMALQAIAGATQGELSIFDNNIVENVLELYKSADVATALRRALEKDVLAYDIETFSLQVDKARIGTFSLALDSKGAISFPVDYGTSDGYSKAVRSMLKEFFVEAKKRNIKLLTHNGSFDSKVLIWELFMEDPEDIKGMLEGLDVMHHRVDDTMTLAYLATNSTAGNKLSLKDQAFEFTGNYALDDIKDITQYSVQKVVRYNGIDAMATYWLWEKHRPTVQAEQEDVYQRIFRPSQKVITQMELCGLPLNLAAVLSAEAQLQDVCNAAWDVINSSQVVQEFMDKYRELLAEEATAKLKKKVKTADDFLHVDFNPNSDKQLPLLLYKGLALPILEKTPGGAGSTSADALAGLVKYEQAHQNRPYVLELLDTLIILGEADKILTTFIPAFKDKSVMKGDWFYLLGSFNLGGTVSGRLSSSNPNMQNLPSTGTKYAKMIKLCFAPPFSGEWLLVGADYFSLEDRISALQTKDPNKLSVYTDGYDGHCLRAYSYFRDRMADITAEIEAEPHRRVEIVNTIAARYPKLRQLSKGPTFALTYGGTWRTLVKNFGLTVQEAKQIEERYHELYVVSDQWVQRQMDAARDCGYVTLAFGLRLRTPVLARTLKHERTLPYEAKKEAKTAGNALGQGYGLLNTHSANLFMERVWNHPEYRYDVLPCAQIHDSQYYLVRNRLGTLKWVNDNLIECMEWNELPEIQHDEVGLGAELEVYYPTWANPISIPNRASLSVIKGTLNNALRNFHENETQNT